MTHKTTHKPGCEALGGYGHGIGPCSCSEAQPEALRLAAWLREGAWHQMRLGDVEAAGRELRRQHAEIERLTMALKNANDQAEQFEREWYLRGDEIDQLKAQLSARQAAPDGWRLVPESPTEEMLDAAHASDCEYSKRAFGGRMHMPQAAEDHWHVMLTAAPPPPEREPLTDEQIMDLVRDECHDMRWPSTAITIFRAGERAHGIGVTNG